MLFASMLQRQEAFALALFSDAKLLDNDFVEGADRERWLPPEASSGGMAGPDIDPNLAEGRNR